MDKIRRLKKDIEKLESEMTALKSRVRREEARAKLFGKGKSAIKKKKTLPKNKTHSKSIKPFVIKLSPEESIRRAKVWFPPYTMDNLAELGKK